MATGSRDYMAGNWTMQLHTKRVAHLSSRYLYPGVELALLVNWPAVPALRKLGLPREAAVLTPHLAFGGHRHPIIQHRHG
jgi:hypothetical protein